MPEQLFPLVLVEVQWPRGLYPGAPAARPSNDSVTIAPHLSLGATTRDCPFRCAKSVTKRPQEAATARGVLVAQSEETMQMT